MEGHCRYLWLPKIKASIVKGKRLGEGRFDTRRFAI
jgi:hypothetical protein